MSQIQLKDGTLQSTVARCIVIIALSYSNVEKVQPSESETRVYDQ